ncbi:hypothetical protein THAOC_29023, partial [Thalassiosira oceanica]
GETVGAVDCPVSAGCVMVDECLTGLGSKGESGSVAVNTAATGSGFVESISGGGFDATVADGAGPGGNPPRPRRSGRTAPPSRRSPSPSGRSGTDEDPSFPDPCKDHPTYRYGMDDDKDCEWVKQDVRCEEKLGGTPGRAIGRLHCAETFGMAGADACGGGWLCLHRRRALRRDDETGRQYSQAQGTKSLADELAKVEGTTYGADGAGEDDDSMSSNDIVRRVCRGGHRRGLFVGDLVGGKQHRRRGRIAGPFRHVGVPVGRRQVRGRRYGSGEGATSSTSPTLGCPNERLFELELNTSTDGEALARDLAMSTADNGIEMVASGTG